MIWVFPIFLSISHSLSRIRRQNKREINVDARDAQMWVSYDICSSFFLHICFKFSINCRCARVVSPICAMTNKNQQTKWITKTKHKRRTFVIQAVIMLCFTYHFSSDFRCFCFFFSGAMCACVCISDQHMMMTKKTQNRITLHLIEKSKRAKWTNRTDVTRKKLAKYPLNVLSYIAQSENEINTSVEWA